MSSFRILPFVLFPLVFAGGCRQSNTFAPPPPPEVTVAPPEVRTVTVYDSIPGRLAAKQVVEIRARAYGYLRKLYFKDGQVVKQGDPLCLIEPEPYQAKLASAQARLAGAKARQRIAEVQYQRRARAFESKAVSEVDMLSAKADLDAAKAEVLDAEAALSEARLRLSYTTNTAPVSGLISRRRVNVGNLVGGTEPTLITTLVVDNPIYAYFNVSERILLKFTGKRKTSEVTYAQVPPIKLRLADGTIYEEAGTVDFVDNRVDPETGTIEVRAVLPNPYRRLLPGLYGEVLIPDVRTNALLVPDLAVQRDIGGSYVLVVGAENKVASKYVQPGPKVEDALRIIESGLDPTNRVVINGLQRARPGVVVTPVSPPPEEKDSAAPASTKPTAPPAPAPEKQAPAASGTTNSTQ